MADKYPIRFTGESPCYDWSSMGDHAFAEAREDAFRKIPKLLCGSGDAFVRGVTEEWMGFVNCGRNGVKRAVRLVFDDWGDFALAACQNSGTVFVEYMGDMYIEQTVPIGKRDHVIDIDHVGGREGGSSSLSLDLYLDAAGDINTFTRAADVFWELGYSTKEIEDAFKYISSHRGDFTGLKRDDEYFQLAALMMKGEKMQGVEAMRNNENNSVARFYDILDHQPTDDVEGNEIPKIARYYYAARACFGARII